MMLFYESFEEAINDIYKADKATSADLYSAVVRYGLYGEEPQLTGICATLWKLMLPNLESGRNKAKAGSKGGKASKRNNPNGRRGKAAAEPSDGSAMDKAEEAPKPEPQRRKPPTLESIRGYIDVNRLNVDAEEFYNYYASRNWEIDGEPIKNIAALLRKWSEKAAAATWQGHHESGIFAGLTKPPR